MLPLGHLPSPQTMTGGQKFCLRWDGFRSRLSSVFDELRQDGELLDVTLCCDGGHTVKAHRILLSASSPCLRQLLKVGQQRG